MDSELKGVHRHFIAPHPLSVENVVYNDFFFKCK